MSMYALPCTFQFFHASLIPFPWHVKSGIAITDYAAGRASRKRVFISSYFFSASPSGKMILNTKKKMIMDTPPVIKVTSRL